MHTLVRAFNILALVHRFLETDYFGGRPVGDEVLIPSFGDSRRGRMERPCRQTVELMIEDEDFAKLGSIARSRTEPTSRVARGRVLLACRATPSFCAVGRDISITHRTVERCQRRTAHLGVKQARDDSSRSRREFVMTDAARSFIVDLACRKAKNLGYPREVWTSRLLAQLFRERGPAAGQPCLADPAQGALYMILDRFAVCDRG